MKKERVRKILRSEFDLIALGLVDEYIFVRDIVTNKCKIQREVETDLSKDEFFRMNDINRIDLFIKNSKPQRIIELDGPYHGFGDEFTKTERTKLRDENYSAGGFTEENHTLIILSENDLAKSDEELIQTLEVKLGMKRIEVS